MKVIFTPLSIVVGLIAGLAAKKAFEQVWGVTSGTEPPDAKHRDIEWTKLIPALLLEGAIFRVVKGVVDHGLRVGFARGTGTWPGEERPDPE